jgi:hypothetical protein
MIPVGAASAGADHGTDAVEASAASGVTSRAPSRAVRAGIVAAAAALVTAPALLVSEFPAGDLHSHVYNAWLRILVERGDAPGLWIAPAWTNVLVDPALVALLRVATPGHVETLTLLASAHATLWSSFLFCRALSHRAGWESLPVLAMLALGWNFHMGFSNWSMSAALSLAAGAALLSGMRWAARAALALPLLGLAALGSTLPPASVAAMTALAVGVQRRWVRPGLLVALAVAFTAEIAVELRAAGRSLYGRDPWAAASGADQLWVFDSKYRWFEIALLAVWSLAMWPWLRAAGKNALATPPFAVAVVATAAGVLLPDAILFPGFDIPASLLALRSSLFAGIAWTAVASLAGYSARRLACTSILAASWTAMLAGDWMSLSRFQESVISTVRGLPPGARIAGRMSSPPSRVAPFTHVVDRACIGRCFAWDNYEPSSAAFGVRATPENTFVIASRHEYAEIEAGTYRVPSLPFSLWKMEPCPAQGGTQRACTSPLSPGDVLDAPCLDPFVRPGKAAVTRCDLPAAATR